MTEPRKLSDSVLLERTQNLVKTERATTTLILEHLLELDRRKLFACLGYSSLFSYCVEHLKYSEAAAMLRISSMRLLRGLTPQEVEAVETKIQDGSLSLSVLAQTQSFFHQEAKAKTPLNAIQKHEVLAAVVGSRVGRQRASFKIVRRRRLLRFWNTSALLREDEPKFIW